MQDLTVELGDEHEAFRTTFRDWLAEHVPDEPTPVDQDARFEQQLVWHRALYGAGWMGIDWPAQYGGREASPLQQFVYYEELGRSGAPTLLAHPSVALVGPTMMVHADEQHKQRYLQRILSGEDLWCQGFSEPDAGSDLASLRTTARREGDRWVIHGQKVWTTWAMYADLCALLCRTEAGGAKHEGLSMLIVDMRQPGIEVRPIRQITGQQEFSEVFFDGAETPIDQIIGSPGDGWRVAMTMLAFERSDQSFTDHAQLLAQVEQLAVLAEDARADGRLGGAPYVTVRQRLADAWSRCQILRSFNLRTAQTLERGEAVGFDGSVVKLYWSELAQDIASLALDLLGPQALAATVWSDRYLESRAMTIYSGTSEIQRNIIAERIAGLPRS